MACSLGWAILALQGIQDAGKTGYLGSSNLLGQLLKHLKIDPL